MNPLIEQWQRICILAERIIKRREAAAVRIPPALRPSYLRAHLNLPMLSPPIANSSSSSSSILPAPSLGSTVPGGSLADSFFGFAPPLDQQSDVSRLTNTLRAVIEVNEHCWRGDECELTAGVRTGLEQVAAHAQRYSEISELRVSTIHNVS